MELKQLLLVFNNYDIHVVPIYAYNHIFKKYISHTKLLETNIKFIVKHF
jgi:hypothetical protein